MSPTSQTTTPMKHDPLSAALETDTAKQRDHRKLRLAFGRFRSATYCSSTTPAT